MEEFKVKATLDIKDATAKLNKMTSQVQTLAGQMKKGSASTKEYSHTINSLTKGLRSYISVYAGIHASKQIVGDLAQLEKGFIGIQKTTDLAGRDLKEFESSLVGLAQKLKGVTIKELQDIATTAGQLGISGKDDILSFSEAISKIAVATNLTAQEAAEGFAIFTNIMDVPIEQTGRLGSVMNELSNTSTATSSRILDFSKRLAGAGKNLGLTGYEVMGLSATLSDIGARVEGGGTALSRVMNKMISDTQGFAKASGQSLEEYTNTVNTKPVKAIQNLINAMSKLDKKGKIQVLKDLKLESEETTSVMLRLASAQDKLAKNLQTASKEWRDNLSLNREYTIASDSLDASIKDMQDSFNILLIILSKDLVPWLKETIDGITDTIIGFKDWSEENRVLVNTLTDLIKFAGELFIILRGLKVLGIAVTVANIGTAFLTLRTAINSTTAALELMRVATAKLSMTPAGLAITALAIALAGATYAWNSYTDELENTSANLKDVIVLNNRTTKTLNSVGKALDSNKELLTITEAERKKQIKGIQNLIASHENEIKALKKSENGSEKYKAEIAHLTSESKSLNQAMVELEKREPIDTEYGKIMNTYTDAVRENTHEINLSNIQHETYKKAISDEIKRTEDNIEKLKAEYSNRGLNAIAIAEQTKRLKNLKKIAKEVSNLKPTSFVDYEKLNKEQQKFVDKTKKLAEQRLKVSKNTKVEIENRETKLYQDLAKLAKELNNIRKKYANERINVLDKIQDKLRNAEQKGMTDVQKYRNDQQVADEKYYKAKEALQSGNLELSKRYLSEYYSLVDSYAGEEITVKKEIQKLNAETGKMEKETINQVQVSRSQTMAEYRSDLQKGSNLELDLLAKQEAEEVARHNEKIEMKQIELEAVKAELEAQKEIISLYKDMFTKSNDVKFAPDFTGFKRSIANIDAQLKKLENKKRTAKIKVVANTGEAQRQIYNLDKKITLNERTLNVNANTTPADFGIKKLVTTYDGDTINIETNPEWEKAQVELDKFRNGEEKQDIKQKVLLESKEAKAELEDIQKDKRTKIILVGETKEVQEEFKRLEADRSAKLNIITNSEEADTKVAELEEDKNTLLTIDADSSLAEASIDSLLEDKTKTITVDAETSSAKSKIKELEKDSHSIHKISADAGQVKSVIAEIKKTTKSLHIINVDNSAVRSAVIQNLKNTSSTHTIHIRKVVDNSTGGYIGEYSTGGEIEKYSNGGFTRRTGKIAGHDLSGKDDVRAMLTRGEFVQNVRAVDHYGVDFMEKINNLQLPRFASGGLVSNNNTVQSNGRTVNVNLNVGDKQFSMVSEESVAIALARYLDKAEF